MYKTEINIRLQKYLISTKVEMIQITKKEISVSPRGI